MSKNSTPLPTGCSKWNGLETSSGDDSVPIVAAAPLVVIAEAYPTPSTRCNDGDVTAPKQSSSNNLTEEVTPFAPATPIATAECFNNGVPFARAETFRSPSVSQLSQRPPGAVTAHRRYTTPPCYYAPSNTTTSDASDFYTPENSSSLPSLPIMASATTDATTARKSGYWVAPSIFAPPAESTPMGNKVYGTYSDCKVPSIFAATPPQPPTVAAPPNHLMNGYHYPNNNHNHPRQYSSTTW